MPTFANIARYEDLYVSRVERDESGHPIFVERLVAEDLMRIFIACRVPITLWGPVGARKTRTIEALSRLSDENGVPYQVITMTPSTQDATIISGIFYTSFVDESNEVVMKRSVPEVAKRVVEYRDNNNGLTIILADEMTTCSNSQQAAMLGLLTHGKFDTFDISDCVAFVMAANPRGTVSQVNDLMESAMNRGGHIAWYGDKDVFFNDWSTGWRGAVEAPDNRTQWFVRQFLDSGEPFRSQRWSPDTLVPYERMEHSERVVTQMSEIYTFINNTLFAGRSSEFDNQVRKHYIVQVVKALMGEQWAHKARVVNEMEDHFVDAKVLLKELSSYQLLPNMTWEGVQPALSYVQSLFANQTVTTPAFIRAAQMLYKSVVHGGEFSLANYCAFFVFILACDSQAQQYAAFALIRDAVGSARQAAQDGHIPQEHIIPDFVPDNFIHDMKRQREEDAAFSLGA